MLSYFYSIRPLFSQWLPVLKFTVAVDSRGLKFLWGIVFFFSSIGFRYSLYPAPKRESVSCSSPRCNPMWLLNVFYCGDRVWGTGGGDYEMFSLCHSSWRTQWVYLLVMWPLQAFLSLLEACSFYLFYFFLNFILFLFYFF